MDTWLSALPWIEHHALSVLIFLPLVGALLLALPIFHPGHDEDGRRARAFGLIITLLTFLVSLGVLQEFRPDGGMQFQEQHAWMPALGISYVLGIDGISLVLILLTTLLMPIVVFASASVKRRTRGYLASMLLLETAMIGTLAALDLFLFYLFWEAMLAPMYLIIGIWGGAGRVHAALKFVLYTAVGSFLMLIGVLYLVWSGYAQTGHVSFLLSDLFQIKLAYREELWLFAAFALAFAIKVPLFPLHTWLPNAHVEAPTGGSVVLAAVLLKMGIYGLLRFAFPLFPRAAAAFAPYLALLAVVRIVYGALVAWAQSDMKKLVAYSSVSHLGYCVLGVAAGSVTALSGSVFQMLSHGFTTGALFLLVGVLYERRHTRAISEYGGLAAQMPVFAFCFLVFVLGSIALPLTTGFIGEFMVLAGSFKAFQLLTGIALAGVIVGAVYMLTLYLKTMYGELDETRNGGLPDLSWREATVLAPLLVLTIVLGVYPQPVLRHISPAAEGYLRVMQDRRDFLNSISSPSPSGDRESYPDGSVPVRGPARTAEGDVHGDVQVHVQGDVLGDASRRVRFDGGRS